MKIRSKVFTDVTDHVSNFYAIASLFATIRVAPYWLLE